MCSISGTSELILTYCFNFQILDLIMKELAGNKQDVLNARLVSSLWNDIAIRRIKLEPHKPLMTRSGFSRYISYLVVTLDSDKLETKVQSLIDLDSNGKSNIE